jgi:hypothetical protein
MTENNICATNTHVSGTAVDEAAAAELVIKDIVSYVLVSSFDFEVAAENKK